MYLLAQHRRYLAARQLRKVPAAPEIATSEVPATVISAPEVPASEVAAAVAASEVPAAVVSATGITVGVDDRGERTSPSRNPVNRPGPKP